MSVMDALRKSKEMMKGHRWNTFVLNLSFLGWKLLGVLTLGILDIFYTNPYVDATDAELYSGADAAVRVGLCRKNGRSGKGGRLRGLRPVGGGCAGCDPGDPLLFYLQLCRRTH